MTSVIRHEEQLLVPLRKSWLTWHGHSFFLNFLLLSANCFLSMSILPTECPRDYMEVHKPGLFHDRLFNWSPRMSSAASTLCFASEFPATLGLLLLDQSGKDELYSKEKPTFDTIINHKLPRYRWTNKDS
ncbi:hypothetical protein FKM82_006653 [Ascaphus truei]